MLLPRVLTAAVGIPLLLYLIHAGGLAWAGFTAAVCILCVYEFGLILSRRRPAGPALGAALVRRGLGAQRGFWADRAKRS